MISVSVVGASGYSGIELLKILARHPGVTIDRLFANSSAGKLLADVAPVFGKTLDIMLEPYAPDKISGSDLVFIALPSGEAMNIVPDILAAGKRVIDLGGDFRLQDTSLYERFYKRPHTAHAVLKQSVYGLPEWNAAQIKTASLVANPGCYPTSAILPLAPLLKEGIIEPAGIAVSSLSGVSGAGRSAAVEMSFGEVNESVRAYKVGTHQHIPEIKTALNAIAQTTVKLSFVPHLLPITRGIFTSSYAALKKSVNEQMVLDVYKKYYGTAPFVRYSAAALPEIKNVAYTNFIDIGFRINQEDGQLVVLSTIDNLIKGAAGQAVQNMNLMVGFNETEGIK
ncbi:MAG: N-acetyl-gamma-glutamyl-phosphate reductase [Ignavibacteriae bacterium]|nr:MAG: N-acetyl-gamma-glutamyl-phosphate reductase [Ignavibacteriota bacterium]